MLLAIDPGVNNCGLAVLTTEPQVTVLETVNVKNARKFTDQEKVIEKDYNARVVKVSHILTSVNDMLDKYPDIQEVSIETPFYNALRPAAYGSLLEVISAIKYNIVIPRKMKLRMIEPLLIKKMFISVKVTKLMTKKQVMKDFLLAKITAGAIQFTGDFDALSEHEIDAIAIGFVSNLFAIEEKLLCSV